MASSSSSSTFVVPGMQNIYQDLLNKNTQNYANVLDAYGQGRSTVAQSLPGISNAYGFIQNQVMGTLGLNGGGWGVAAPAAKDIQRAFTQANAKSQQAAINAGLGNSTVLASMNRGNASEAARAYGALGAQLAQTAAGVQERTGMAQQQAQMHGLDLLAQLYGQQGGTLGNYRFANTAGDLTGNQSSSVVSDPAGGSYGGGGRGGSSQGAAGAAQADFNRTFGGFNPNPGGSFGYSGGYQYPGYYQGDTPAPAGVEPGGYGGGWDSDDYWNSWDGFYDFPGVTYTGGDESYYG